MGTIGSNIFLLCRTMTSTSTGSQSSSPLSPDRLGSLLGGVHLSAHPSPPLPSAKPPASSASASSAQDMDLSDSKAESKEPKKPTSYDTLKLKLASARDEIARLHNVIRAIPRLSSSYEPTDPFFVNKLKVAYAQQACWSTALTDKTQFRQEANVQTAQAEVDRNKALVDLAIKNWRLSQMDYDIAFKLMQAVVSGLQTRKDTELHAMQASIDTAQATAKANADRMAQKNRTPKPRTQNPFPPFPL